MVYKLFVLGAVEMDVVQNSLGEVFEDVVELSAAHVFQVGEGGFLVEREILLKKPSGRSDTSLRLII
jgi:hypothetical protein